MIKVKNTVWILLERLWMCNMKLLLNSENKKKVKIGRCVVSIARNIGILGVLLFAVPQAAQADVERYLAVPMGAGGYVFILDTREGHAWIWNNAGQGQVSKSGENPRFVYQGNVRNNMKPPKPPVGQPAVTPSQPDRF